jgi:hypothetical protein
MLDPLPGRFDHRGVNVGVADETTGVVLDEC